MSKKNDIDKKVNWEEVVKEWNQPLQINLERPTKPLEIYKPTQQEIDAISFKAPLGNLIKKGVITRKQAEAIQKEEKRYAPRTTIDLMVKVVEHMQVFTNLWNDRRFIANAMQLWEELDKHKKAWSEG